MKYNTLYHIDENENTRIWYMECEGNKYRAISGIEDGKLVISEWKEVFGKNTGKANVTTDEAQAHLEVQALYKKKLDRKYVNNKDEIIKSHIIEPMLAASFKGWDPKWRSVFTQPKLDGMRCIATRDGLFSRQGKKIVSVPHIYEALSLLFIEKPDLILDGELYNHDLKDNFEELISLCRKTKPEPEDLVKAAKIIQYHVYDVVNDDNFIERDAQAYIWTAKTASNCIRYVETLQIGNSYDLDQNYGKLLADGYEGQMIRHNTPYEHKRSKSLMKRKEFIDDEFEIIEILEGQGNWAGYAKSVQCKTKAGVIFNAGIKGSQDFNRQLLNDGDKYKVATVRYQNMTPDGSLRFPIAVAFYENERDV